MPADLSTLIAALSDANPRRRSAAADELSQLGEEARAAAVPLVRAAGDASEEVREWAAAALEELGPPSAEDAPALIPLLNTHADAGFWAATLLGRLGDEAADAVRPLAATLAESKHIAVRQRAAWALGRIGPSAASAATALRQAAKSSDARLARISKDALKKIEV